MSPEKSFQKLFSGDIFLHLLNIFATAASKLKQKIQKNYSSILAIANHRNWLNDSPPLNVLKIYRFLYYLRKKKQTSANQIDKNSSKCL